MPGLDYYNHNLDTSPEYYGEIITTRTYQDRLDTLDMVRDAGINVCCGGIVGMGEEREDRVGMIARAGHPARSIRKACRSTCWCRSRARRSPSAGARSARFRAHDRGRAHHHAEIDRAAVGRARGDERRDAGAVFSRRRQLDFLRRETADHAEPRRAGPRPRAVRRLGHARRWRSDITVMSTRSRTGTSAASRISGCPIRR